MVEGRTYPCTEIGILLKSRKNYMLVPVPVVWYRYHFATGDFLLGGTGTSTGLPGTGTKWLLVNFFFGVPVPVCLVPVPLPLQLFPNTIALPKTSQQWLPSSAMIYIRSLDTNSYNNYARNPKKNLHKSKNTRTIKGTYYYTK